MRDSTLESNIHSRFANTSALGVYQDDTVRTTYAIHRTGGGILQNREGFNLVWVYVVQASFNAVYQDERVSAGLEGADATDPEGGIVVTGLS